MSAVLRVVIAVAAPHGDRLAAELTDDGAVVAAVLAPGEVGPELRDAASRLRKVLAEVDAIVVTASRDVLTSDVVSACDRHGVRILPIAEHAADVRWARSFGLAEPLPSDAEGWRVADTVRLARSPRPSTVGGRVIAVWGAHGAPGRSTIATELAVELGRGGGRAALVDADTHAPSLTAALGLAEDSPGIAAAARRAASGSLDAAELTRISAPLDVSGVEVLTGLNRPTRWPELSDDRMRGVLDACRSWVDAAVVDIAASLERDEEIVSDIAGPRRNAATLAALEASDVVVAVAAADPVGITRFLRAYAELRGHVGRTPVHVVVNRLRGGALGIDARGQVRRTLSRYAGVDDLSFVPYDLRAADAALLAARPIGEASPRSALAQSVRRIAHRVMRIAPGEEGVADAPRSRRERYRTRAA